MSALDQLKSLTERGYDVSLCAGERCNVFTIVDWDRRKMVSHIHPDISKAIYGAIAKLNERPS